jgi:glycosyltransferase involved in cell wall biosynthesis
MSKKLYIVVPAYNEERTIEKVVDDILSNSMVDKCIVVDNNSSDITQKLVRRQVKRYGNKLEILYEKKQGKGNALKLALDTLASQDVDYIGLIDADDTYPAKEFDSMLQDLVDRKLDMILGNRFQLGGYQKSNDRPGHVFGNKIISKIIKINSGVEVEDALSGMRIFSKRFLRSFKNISNSFQLETEFSMHCGNSGLRYGEFPIHFNERDDDNPSKLNTVRDGFSILKFALIHSALTISTKIGFLLGVSFLVTGLFFCMMVIYEFIIQNTVTSVATAVAGGLFLIVGTQFLLNSGLDSRLRRIERALMK